MYCKYCGKEISDDSAFCKHCGKSVSDVTSHVRATDVPSPKQFIWSSDNVEEKLIMKAENNQTLLYISIVLGIIWALVIIASFFLPTARSLVLTMFLITAIPLTILILQIHTRTLYFTNLKVVGSHGIILSQRMDVPLDMITSVQVKQDFIGDSIIISTASDRYVWHNINNANAFMKGLLHQREINKK